MKIRQTLILSVVVLTGCSSAGNPGTTLWAGLTNYREEMRTLEAKPERWPERQRLAESIKTTYVVIDQGSCSSAVRTPEGQTFHCTTRMVSEEGASIRCQPVGGKS